LGHRRVFLKSVKEEGQQILGYPAFEIKDYFRSYAVFKRLPELNDRLRELEKKMAAVTPAETASGNGQ
jgi:UDP-3-O-[3-hydroxymyristoyl] glucosamine N-acyltransferase